MGNSRGLTREQILAVGKPPGYRLLADFLAELERGEIPRTATTERLAVTFRAFLAGTADALELTKKRGERGKGDASERQRRRIAKFIDDHMNADSVSRGRRKRALDAAVRRFRSLGRRRIEYAWKELGPSVAAERRLSAAIGEQIRWKTDFVQWVDARSGRPPFRAKK